jgi:hypothetical protein
VYKLTNSNTDEFYIGYRYKNVGLGLSAEQDLGHYYFTSSKHIAPIFNQFTYEIIAEFYLADDAYDFEQELIKENFLSPLCLNKHYQKNNEKGRWKNSGHTEETKKKMRGLVRSAGFKNHRSRIMTGNVPWNKGLTKESDTRMADLSSSRKKAGNDHQLGIKHSPERTEKIRAKLTGRRMTDEQIIKMSNAKKGKTWEEIFGKDGADQRKNSMARGATHGQAKAVSTPLGLFGTVREAAAKNSLTEGTVRAHCLSDSVKWVEWYYVGMEDISLN